MILPWAQPGASPILTVGSRGFDSPWVHGKKNYQHYLLTYYVWLVYLNYCQDWAFESQTETHHYSKLPRFSRVFGYLNSPPAGLCKFSPHQPGPNHLRASRHTLLLLYCAFY